VAARPCWLLLALVLLLAGQFVVAAHWHSDNISDRHCTLCAFGAANNAITISAFALSVSPLHEQLLCSVVLTPVFLHRPAQRNRGPPALLLK